MTGSDGKFFLMIAVIGVIAYGLFFPWNWSRYPWVYRPPATPTKTYIVVPRGTPGAVPIPIEHKRGW
jgi:hypothetical protein